MTEPDPQQPDPSDEPEVPDAPHDGDLAEHTARVDGPGVDYS